MKKRVYKMQIMVMLKKINKEDWTSENSFKLQKGYEKHLKLGSKHFSIKSI